MATGRIFINYRREDTRGESGRIYDFLSARFPGQVFRDVGSLEPGADWQQAIGRVISQSDACIVVIGCNWLDIKGDDGKRRLDDPADTVRREVFAALQREIMVIPVLVAGAELPKPRDLPPDLQALCAKNALEITEQDWAEGCQKLAHALDLALRGAARNVAVSPEKKSSGGKWLLACAVGAAISLITVVAAVSLNKQPSWESKQTAPVTRPVPPAATPSSMIGMWGAVVNTDGSTLNEMVEIYGDQSFRALLNGTSQAVGRWQSDALGQLVLTNATNLVSGLHFSCGSRSNEDGTGTIQGNCSDEMDNIWSFSMSKGVGVPVITFIPRVDVSQLSLAERAAFAQLLSGRRCTCPCGMSVYMCLQKDPNCDFSPGIARNVLAGFLRSVRGG